MKIFIKLIAFVAVLTAIVVGCDDNKIESPRQLLAKEQARLATFLDSIPQHDNPDNLNFKDYWTSLAVDTVDQSLYNGIIYFEMETGDGDVVSAGKEVGIRYEARSIVVDDNEHPYLGEPSDNYDDQDPLYYEVGNSTIPSGIQQAVELMRKNGKCKVVIPSTLGETSYVTTVYDIEVTYLSK